MSCEDWLGVWNGLVFPRNTVSLYWAFESVLAWQKSQELLYYSLKTLSCKLYTQLEAQGVKAGLSKFTWARQVIGSWKIQWGCVCSAGHVSSSARISAHSGDTWAERIWHCFAMTALSLIFGWPSQDESDGLTKTTCDTLHWVLSCIK